MNTQNKNTNQKIYQSPVIFRIDLDREISLQLASDANPSEEPGWSEYRQSPLAPNGDNHTNLA